MWVVIYRISADEVIYIIDADEVVDIYLSVTGPKDVKIFGGQPLFSGSVLDVFTLQIDGRREADCHLQCR